MVVHMCKVLPYRGVGTCASVLIIGEIKYHLSTLVARVARVSNRVIASNSRETLATQAGTLADRVQARYCHIVSGHRKRRNKKKSKSNQYCCE